MFGGRGAGAADALDEASVLSVPGRSGMAGRYQGREAIVGVFRRMGELARGTLRFSPSELVAAGDELIVLIGRTTAACRGRTLDSEVAFIVAIDAGVVRRIWVFHDDQNEVDEFWS